MTDNSGFIPAIWMLLVMIFWLLWCILSQLKKMTPPKLVVRDDLILEDTKPGPIVHYKEAPVFEPGDRVRVTGRAGFHRGATGSVVFQEPNEQRCWVMRDGASSPVYYFNYELEAK